jgi:hypothetical protein
MPALPLRTVCFFFLFAAAALAEDKARKSPLTKTLDDAVEWFDVETVEPDQQKLTPVKALAWNNEDRTASSQGLTVLYVTAGRPYATVCIFRWEGYINHHFGSLTSSKLVAKDSRSGQAIWSPTDAGIEWQRRTDAEPPHTSPARRLRQMKAIAEQFTVNMTGWNPGNTDKQKLRLLPTPIYRYETKEAEEDGAVFAFVTGVDPEALLLIESRSSEGKLHWEYAFARRTSGGLEAYDKETLVWSAKKGPVETDPKGTYRATSRKVPPECLKVEGEE